MLTAAVFVIAVTVPKEPDNHNDNNNYPKTVSAEQTVIVAASAVVALVARIAAIAHG